MCRSGVLYFFLLDQEKVTKRTQGFRFFGEPSLRSTNALQLAFGSNSNAHRLKTCKQLHSLTSTPILFPEKPVGHCSKKRNANTGAFERRRSSFSFWQTYQPAVNSHTPKKTKTHSPGSSSRKICRPYLKKGKRCEVWGMRKKGRRSKITTSPKKIES